jgi:hypothetical protein
VFAALPSVHAGYAKIKAKGTANYGVFGPSTENKRTAVADAKKKALQKYISGLDQVRANLLEPLKGEILADIDVYVPEVAILTDESIKDTKTYAVVVEASIDESQIEKLIATHGGGEAAQAAGSEESTIVFIFVAREAESVRQFKDRTTDKIVLEESGAAQEASGVDNKGEFIGSYKKTDEASVTTGGTSIKRSDEVAYRLSEANDAQTRIQEVLSKANLQVVDPADADVAVSEFKSDYAMGSDVSPETRKKAVAACRAKGVRFLAVGSLDVGMQDKDSVTGLTRVYVTVNSKVTDLDKKIPVTIASIGPVQYAGLGANAQVARNNALVEAAGEAAQDLVDQIRAKSRK